MEHTRQEDAIWCHTADSWWSANDDYYGPTTSRWVESRGWNDGAWAQRANVDGAENWHNSSWDYKEHGHDWSTWASSSAASSTDW